MNLRLAPISYVVLFSVVLAAVDVSTFGWPLQALSATGDAVGPRGTIRLNGTLIPAPHVRAIVVIVRHGLGQTVFEDPAWREFAHANNLALLRVAGLASSDIGELKDADRVQKNSKLGGGRALLSLVSAISKEARRSDIGAAPLIIWGHSAAASFARSFGAEYPDRTAAVVSYQGNTRDVPVDVSAMAHVPTLVFAGEKDEQAGVQNSLEFWQQGRKMNAPWAFVLEPGATHGSPEALKRSHTVTFPWLQAVVALRVASDGRLRNIVIDAGWHVDHGNYSVFRPGEVPPPGRAISWLPDEVSVKSWRTITGRQGLEKTGQQPNKRLQPTARR